MHPRQDYVITIKYINKSSDLATSHEIKKVLLQAHSLANHRAIKTHFFAPPNL